MKPKRKTKTTRSETAFDRMVRRMPSLPPSPPREEPMLYSKFEYDKLWHERCDAERTLGKLKEETDEAIRNYRSTIGILAAELTHANAEIAGLQRGK